MRRVYMYIYSAVLYKHKYIRHCSPNQTIWRRYPPLPRAHLHKCNQESEQCSSIYDEIYVASSIHYDKQLRVGRQLDVCRGWEAASNGTSTLLCLGGTTTRGEGITAASDCRLTGKITSKVSVNDTSHFNLFCLGLKRLKLLSVYLR